MAVCGFDFFLCGLAFASRQRQKIKGDFMKNQPVERFFALFSIFAILTGSALLLSACAPAYDESPKADADPGSMSKSYDDKMGKMSKSDGGTMKKSNSSY